jgi:hypothetical protein
MDEEQILTMVKLQHRMDLGALLPDFLSWSSTQQLVNTSSHLTEQRLHAVLALFSDSVRRRGELNPAPKRAGFFASGEGAHASASAL